MSIILVFLAATVWGGVAEASERQPVLVELFTSEGCSSCPPADALLARLDVTQPIRGARVISLDEHVDYWNGLGWRDPWSAAQFTRRQNRYASTSDGASVYTPEMVVNGETGFVGSNAARAREVIASATHAPQAVVTLARAGALLGNAVSLSIGITQAPVSFRGQVAEAWLP
ncbi:MAG: DUF1223 domain-containing protein [Rhodanobacteraceae bacterium]|nr:MAG: DUF1223 domain-containing protein [Rhodanobacteraceae bacterium]